MHGMFAFKGAVFLHFQAIWHGFFVFGSGIPAYARSIVLPTTLTFQMDYNSISFGHGQPPKNKKPNLRFTLQCLPAGDNKNSSLLRMGSKDSFG
jgi:hypothetical protein